jgi:hypothetical protein
MVLPVGDDCLCFIHYVSAVSIQLHTFRLAVGDNNIGYGGDMADVA